jgi:hypothetical protein
MVSTTAQPTAESVIHQIGETAGVIWHILNDDGPQPLSKLVKRVDAPRDVAMQAVGWLAHEEKIDIQEQKRTRIVSLR